MFFLLVIVSLADVMTGKRVAIEITPRQMTRALRNKKVAKAADNVESERKHEQQDHEGLRMAATQERRRAVERADVSLSRQETKSGRTNLVSG